MGKRSLPGMLCLLALTGCFSNNPDALKEHTADATAAARRATGQIAKGVVEGLFRRGPYDLNTVPARQLEKMPGMTPALAAAVIAGRPYAEPRELVSRHILTKAQFNRIKAQIKVEPPKTREGARSVTNGKESVIQMKLSAQRFHLSFW